MSFWHTLTNPVLDPFGVGTMIRLWNGETDPMKPAKIIMEVAFEFMNKIGIDYFTL